LAHDEVEEAMDMY